MNSSSQRFIAAGAGCAATAVLLLASTNAGADWTLGGAELSPVRVIDITTAPAPTVTHRTLTLTGGLHFIDLNGPQRDCHAVVLAERTDPNACT